MGREWNMLGGESRKYKGEKERSRPTPHTDSLLCAETRITGLCSQREGCGVPPLVSLYLDLRTIKTILTEWAEKGTSKRVREAIFIQENTASRHECWSWDANIVVCVICWTNLHKTHPADNCPHSREKYCIEKTLILDMRWFWANSSQIALIEFTCFFR